MLQEWINGKLEKEKGDTLDRIFRENFIVERVILL
jgi:hypothetical protein